MSNLAPERAAADDRLPDDLARAVADPASYVDLEALHETFRVIRRDHPFARADLPDYAPFWVASKFDDIQTVARQNDLFLSGLGALANKKTLALAREAGEGFRSVVGMNQPDHAKYRLLTQAWLVPKNLRKLEDGMRKLARRYVARLDEAGGEIDFVQQIAVHYPLLVVMSILGVPPEDEPMMLRLTQEYFGAADDEMARKAGRTPEEIQASTLETIAEVSAYFRRITEDRRRQPADDLASVIANGRIDGELIPELDSLGYYITIAFAGHDTTSSSVAGGLWALAERPDQLAKVKADPGLIHSLVEESIRWTSPVYQFTRVAARDAEVRGQTVRAGEQVALCFPSGNRDEEAFEDPFEFRVDRKTNRHVAFGYGPHQCLGMHLARMEMAIFFEELLPRLKSVELAGQPRRTKTNFLGGPKTLPLRYELA
jgi:cytochrome P450